MIIKLKRMVKREGGFIPANTIVDIENTEALFLIKAKAAVEVNPIVVQAAVVQEPAKEEPKVQKVASVPSDTVTPDIINDPVDTNSSDGEVVSDEIDISKFKIVEDAPVPIPEGPYQIPGLDSNAINVLVKAGYTTIDSLKGIKIDALIALPKIGYQKATKIAEFVKGF